jgi:tetratricopeptide (TPR) repeat protein
MTAPESPAKSNRRITLTSRIFRAIKAVLGAAFRRPLATLLLLALLATLTIALGVGINYFQFRQHLHAARIEVERGHNAAASGHLLRCQSLWVPTRETLLLTARVARRSGEWEEASALLEAYSQRYGDDEDLVAERLMLNATVGQLEEAAPLLLQRIHEKRPEARLAREAIIVGLLYQFRWHEAEQNIAVWMNADSDDPFAWLLRGKLFEQRQQVDDALASYRKVLELDSEHDEARLRMTTLLLQQRKTEELLDHLGHLRIRLPHLAEVQIQWVKALALQGRTEESREALDACLERFPDFAPALAQRGAVALQSGDDRTAEEYLGRASRLAPGDFTTRSQYVAVLARNGKEVEAEREKTALRQLEDDQERIGELISGPLQSRPNDPAVPHEIATIAMRSGQPAEAVRWLQTALQRDSNYAPTHQVLSNYYHAMGNPALAAKHRALARQGVKRP